MKTPALTLEYNQLDQRHQDLKAMLRGHCDTIKVMQEMNRIMERKKQIALECFGVTENQSAK